MKQSIFPLLALLISLSACRDRSSAVPLPPTPTYCLEEGSDYLIPLVDSCRTQPFVPMGNIWIQPNVGKYLYGSPIVNPLDSDVIVYSRSQPDTLGTAEFLQVWTLNLCTGEKALLATELVSETSISMDGWLVYRTYEGSWKVKLNGDSLTKLAEVITDFDWHPSGEKMIGLTLSNKWALLDANGQIIQMLDSINGHRHPLWSPNGEHIAFNGYHSSGSFVYLYNVSSQQIDEIPIPLKVGYHFWLDEDHLLVSHKSGDLVSLNIHTQQIVDVVQPTCVNKSYFASDINQDGKYLLCTYDIFEESTPGSSLLNRYTKLVVMNMDGSNVREIVVD